MDALTYHTSLVQAWFRSSTDFIFIVDQNSQLLDILPTQSAMAAKRELIGLSIRHFMPEAEATQYQDLIQKALTSREPQEYIHSLTYGDDLMWLTDTITAMDDTRVLCIARLITDPRALEQAQSTLHLYQAMVEYAPFAMSLHDFDLTITYTNDAFEQLFGNNLVGRPMASLIPDDRGRVLKRIQEHLQREDFWLGELEFIGTDGNRFPASSTLFLIRDANEKPAAIAAISQDMTQQHRAEQERLELREQMIAAQQIALRELSTPLIPLADGIVVLPLVGSIDSMRAQQIMETLLVGIGEHQAETAILDVTGVQIIDTQVANALLRAAQAAKLLGAQVILTGISADIAQTLVHLGANMHHITTLGNLQSAIWYALDQQKSVQK